jgi:ribosomal protein L11 methyltransferase
MDTGNYCELVIEAADASLRELLIAHLAEMGYEGFEESGDILKAYVAEAGFSEINLNILSKQHSFKYSKSIIKNQNWNAVWESNFDPVQVDDFVGIRAGFHPPFQGVEHEIVITPKMSFGTGHHATTWMMMQLMRDISFKDRSVFDFGTGTGILAILAEKLGAAEVLAVDHDEWCIENTSENILINNCKNIDIQKVDDAKNIKKYDIILANINKNIILENIQALGQSLGSRGQLLLSGLLQDDEEDIIRASAVPGLIHKRTIHRNGWIAIWLYTN